jgi:hypothetical protein
MTVKTNNKAIVSGLYLHLEENNKDNCSAIKVRRTAVSSSKSSECFT